MSAFNEKDILRKCDAIGRELLGNSNYFHIFTSGILQLTS